MKSIPPISQMPIDDFSHQDMADLAPRAINPLLGQALTAYANGRLQESADTFSTLIEGSAAEAALIERSSWKSFFAKAPYALPPAEAYPKIRKVDPEASTEDALDVSEVWHLLFTIPNQKGPRTESIKSNASTANLLASTYLTARGTIYLEMGLTDLALSDFDNATRCEPNHVAFFRSGLTGAMLGYKENLESPNCRMRIADACCPKAYRLPLRWDDQTQLFVLLNEMSYLVFRNNLFEIGSATMQTHYVCALIFLTGNVNSIFGDLLRQIRDTRYPYAIAVWAEGIKQHVSEHIYLLYDKDARDAGYDVNRFLHDENLTQRREWLKTFLAEDPARQMVCSGAKNENGFTNMYNVTFESRTDDKLPDYTDYLRGTVSDAFNFYDLVKEFTNDRDIIGEVFLNTALHTIYIALGSLPMQHLDELASQLYLALPDTGHGDLYDSYNEFRLDMYSYLLKDKQF